MCFSLEFFTLDYNIGQNRGYRTQSPLKLASLNRKRANESKVVRKRKRAGKKWNFETIRNREHFSKNNINMNPLTRTIGTIMKSNFSSFVYLSIIWKWIANNCIFNFTICKPPWIWKTIFRKLKTYKYYSKHNKIVFKTRLGLL